MTFLERELCSITPRAKLDAFLHFPGRKLHSEVDYMVFLERIWCFLQPMQKHNKQIYAGISDNFEEATSTDTVVQVILQFHY